MFNLLTDRRIYSVLLVLIGSKSFAQESQMNQMIISADTSGIDAFLLVVLLAFLCAPIYIYLNRIKEDASRKRRALHIFTPKEQNIILMMASAAKTDNEIALSEVIKIREVIQNMTSRKVSIPDVQKMLKLASNSFNKRDIQGAITGVSHDEKRELLMALFGVIAADGKLRKEEREFSRRFCKDMNISQAFFDATWVDYFESNPQRLTVE